MSEKPHIDSIFHTAIEIESDEERRDHLNEICGDDEDLLRQVERLVNAHFEGGSILDSPPDPLGDTIDQPTAEGPGTLIGPYKLLQQIGEGGMGVVYMAEQKSPVKRRVALKIIKPGMDSKQIIARFEAERQALAMMDHPNVARVLDAGTTENGRPYFVMELVKGVPITAYCDANHLTTRQRLELLIDVCHAIQHAHHKGIIHRDLKPSNVLIAEYDDQAIPKIIDFGVAKALNQSLTEKTMFTQFGQIVGTLEYMSPEQAKFNQLDVDTRSDIYSLGVLLYELLTGTTPFDRKRLLASGLHEMVRIIGEEEPPKPSTRLNTSSTLPALAANRSEDARKLAGLVRGELDWITMKALEKDRTLRYETASALAADVERYVNHEPVQACPPSMMYRLRKHIYRNRTLLSRFAVAAVIVVLSTVAISSAWQYKSGLRDLANQKTESEREKAAREKQRSLEQQVRERLIPEIRQLVANKQFVAAYDRAQEAERVLPNEPALAELRQSFAQAWSIQTYPIGADVYWRDYDDPEAIWTYAGRTPIESINLPRSMLLWKVSREGFETVTGCRHPEDDRVEFTLDRSGELPAGMVRISGNAFRPNFYGVRFDDIVLSDFFIDRCEVTNRQYKQFVDADGYETAAYWDTQFFRGREVLSWVEVKPLLVDITNRAGPSTWSNGTYPEGEGDFPVHGVSWYEAAAYARFVGKELPTAVEWLRACGSARHQSMTIAQQSNLEGDGLVAVASKQGIGPFGTFDMAGNVREWCHNEGNPGRRTILGASWNEPAYRFGGWDQSDSLARDPANGFRCVKRSPELLPDAALAAIPFGIGRDLMQETPVDDEMFELCRSIYVERESNTRGLGARLVSQEKQHDAIHEVIEINAGYGSERFAVHLFLPLGGKPPFQPVLFLPGVGRFEIEQPFPSDFSKLWANPRFIIRSGRALVWPVYDGSFERFGSYGKDPEWQVHIFRDLIRTIDYLETRSDTFDAKRIGYLGQSLGGWLGPIFASLDDRIRTSILYHGGIPDSRVSRAQEDTLNFAPRVKTPTLMINGRNDPVFNVERSQVPLYHFLGCPPEQKAYLLFEGGHGTDARQWHPDALAWLDLHLGPVGRQQKRSQLLSQANFAAARGAWGEVAAGYVEATQIKPSQNLGADEGAVWLSAAIALRLADDEAGYQQLCSSMIAEFADRNEPWILARLLATCLLWPGSIDLSELPINEMVKAMNDKATDDLRPWTLATAGLVAMRQDNPTEAIRQTKLALEAPLPIDHPVRALGPVISSLARIKLGKTADAEKQLAAATEMIDRMLPKLDDGRVDSRFAMRMQTLRVYWLLAEILRREADTLLDSARSSTTQP